MGSNAISDWATAVAAAVALLVWISGIVVGCNAKKKRIAVSQHLLIEELVRVSSHAVHVWRLANETNISAKKISWFARDIEIGLQVNRSEELALYVGELPMKLGIALAKFIASADMLRSSYSMVERSLIEVDGVKAIPHIDSMLVLSQLSLALIPEAEQLAKELEAETGAPVGTIHKKVQTLKIVEGMPVRVNSPVA